MRESSRDWLAELDLRIAAKPAEQEDKTVVLDFVSQHWDAFYGSNAGGMKANKLIGRVEDVRWDRPYLTFRIERHGAASLGSIYAEMQEWSVNLSTGVVGIVSVGRRRIGLQDKPLKVQPIADEIAKAILGACPHPAVKFLSVDRVILDIAEIIPATNAQTTSARRRRFADALAKMLAEAGWVRSSKAGRPQFERRVREAPTESEQSAPAR